MQELQTVEVESARIAPTAAAIAMPLVLVADANPASRQRRMRQLEDGGFRVAVARTSFEAIVKASCHLPNLILVDASLGKAGAEDPTELLSICPATAHIPIVRLTAGRRVPTRVLAAAR